MMRHAPGATCAQQAPTRRTHHRSREGGPWPARVRLCPGMGGTPQRSEPWLFTVTDRVVRTALRAEASAECSCISLSPSLRRLKVSNGYRSSFFRYPSQGRSPCHSR